MWVGCNALQYFSNDTSSVSLEERIPVINTSDLHYVTFFKQNLTPNLNVSIWNIHWMLVGEQAVNVFSMLYLVKVLIFLGVISACWMREIAELWDNRRVMVLTFQLQWDGEFWIYHNWEISPCNFKFLYSLNPMIFGNACL